MINKCILVIYPEVHETRIGIYRNMDPVFLKTIRHNDEDLAAFSSVPEQKTFRKDAILKELKRNDLRLENIAVVMGRSGMVKPVSQGVFEINNTMINDLTVGVMGMHETNLGGLIAFDLANELGVKAYMANPVVVDELTDLARVTGHPMFERKSIFHALNHKHVACKYSKSVHKKYTDLNLIVCHVGSGGVSIGAHQKGKVVDVNQAFDGGGPFSIRRTGTLPMGQLVHLCFSGKYTEQEVMEMITSKGGYFAYLGTDNVNAINRMIAEGDEKARFISMALAYAVSKEIASHYATLEGKVDAIILTGLIFDSELFLEDVKNRVGGIAPIALYPSVNDLEALASYGLGILKGEVTLKEYI
ncbi:MAG: butyrate kinase [Bacteroidales bacterium]|nr:butyrate kinase [Bacteroidales bacterium]